MNIDPSIQSLLGYLYFDPDALKAKYLAERDRRLRQDGSQQFNKSTLHYENLFFSKKNQTLVSHPQCRNAKKSFEERV